MSYGPHPNDFLLAECGFPGLLSVRRLWIRLDGFFLDHNDSEAIYLDDLVFRDLNDSQLEELRLGHYYGYVTVGISFSKWTCG